MPSWSSKDARSHNAKSKGGGGVNRSHRSDSVRIAKKLAGWRKLHSNPEGVRVVYRSSAMSYALKGEHPNWSGMPFFVWSFSWYIPLKSPFSAWNEIK